MESSRYWQDYRVVMDKTFIDGQERRGLSLECPVVGKGDGGKIVYGGRLIPVDVYLAVPTFIRRGITIAV